MTARLVALGLDADNPAGLARFWAALLGREEHEDAGGTLLPGEDGQLSLRFVPGRTGKVGPYRVHLHLTSTSDADQQHRVAAAVRLGATHLDVGQRPEEGHVVLADPEGHPFCVIEPGNAFLAGCGLLGELACDGGREVGLFWSRALGWPLVWDRDQETAVQSPMGGTKIAWGGPSGTAQRPPDGQRFDLFPLDGDQGAEVERLVSLGAARRGVDEDGAVVLADPGGTPFRLIGRPAPTPARPGPTGDPDEVPAIAFPSLADPVVVLRRWDEADAGQQLAAFTDPVFLTFSDWAPQDEDELRRRMARQEAARLRGEQTDFAVTSPADARRVLGGVSLNGVDPVHRRASLGYWLAPAARGQGVASHAVRLVARWAFETLSLARLEITCGPDNHGSQQVAERCGFTREGLLRSHQTFRGGRRDSVLFSLLPGELR